LEVNFATALAITARILRKTSPHKAWSSAESLMFPTPALEIEPNADLLLQYNTRCTLEMNYATSKVKLGYIGSEPCHCPRHYSENPAKNITPQSIEQRGITDVPNACA